MGRRRQASSDSLDILAPGKTDLASTLVNVAADIVLPRPEQTATATAEAERSLLEFTRQAWHTIEPGRQMVPGWVIGCICEHLEAVSSRQIRDLIINIPPGMMKSVLCCVMWPAWVWVRDPGARWIFGAYGQGLAYRDSDRTRDVIASNWYQSRWGHVFQLKRSWNTKERFANTRQGYRIATTIGGKAMGERADYLVYDDAHKASEAHSPAARAQVIRSWTGTMSTRASDPKTVRKLVIMQRLHERDLSGYLLAEVGGYQHLCLPMSYEPKRYWFPWAQGGDGSDATGRGMKPRDAIVPTVLQQERPHLRDGPEGSGRSRPGDLLWPERFPEAEVEKLRLTLQAVGTAGQLQQRPGPEKGTIFKTEFFKHFTLERGPDGELLVVLGLHDPTTGARPPTLAATEFRFFQTCDTALTISEQSAYTAVVTFAWHRVRRWLLIWDVWRHRLDVHEQLPALYELRDGKGTWDPGSRTWIVPGAARRWPRPLILQGVEYKGSGIGIVNEAAAQGKPLVPLKAVTDKVQRAATAATMYGAGQIWHLAGANWLPDLEDELRAFPQGAFADQVDSVSYGANLAVEDALLNASIEGALWMDEPMNSNGLPMTPEDVRLAGRNMEVVHVAGHRIVFDDTDDFGRS